MLAKEDPEINNNIILMIIMTITTTLIFNIMFFVIVDLARLKSFGQKGIQRCVLTRPVHLLGAKSTMTISIILNRY